MADQLRYAIYYAPRPATALARFGAAWLGRDAEGDGPPPPPPDVQALPVDRDAVTSAARRYGFHATLKAPFRLGTGHDPEALVAAAAALASRLAPFHLPPLRLEVLGPFLALTPASACPALDAAAAECIMRLDPFRAPLTHEDVARRRAAGLTPAQEAHLARWGYPYVLDEFRFHLTLTDRLAPADQAAVAAALAPSLAPVLAERARFEDLCVFAETAGGPLRVLARLPLTAAATASRGS